MDRPYVTVEGNEAAASIAYQLSEVIAIYPITPASPMGEVADSWAAAGKLNLFGTVPEVMEMQSEAGAAGTVHGALQAGALSTTFTSSQGLLLMIPNMFKIAGELTPTVFHVAARTLATHALSIFGDQCDVMAVRSTGWAMLASASVQEVQDMAMIAHAATLEARVPFLHFFDGFRTSHEVNKIEQLTDEDIRAMIDEDLGARAPRPRPDARPSGAARLGPESGRLLPGPRGGQPVLPALPGIVQETMDRFAGLVGRQYHLFDYVGRARRRRGSSSIMGSGVGAVEETVEDLVGGDEEGRAGQGPAVPAVLRRGVRRDACPKTTSGSRCSTGQGAGRPRRAALSGRDHRAGGNLARPR